MNSPPVISPARPSANGASSPEAGAPLLFPGDFCQREGVYHPARLAAEEFSYTDGDATEAEIHRIVRSARDRSVSSFELERSIRDWPTEYHLSRARTNLLRPFQLNRFDSVLEIGSGCGAITRYLGENCRRVTALEGSANRAAIVRDRCADLKNVTCVCSNLQDVRFAERFDLVVVIGVLEYAGKFLAGHADPWQHFLDRVHSAMAPGGACILAIENQLGIKYFGGAPEDHTSRSFEGLEGYYPGTQVRTFGRAELIRRFEDAGLTPRLFLPFPDYKLPRLILNAEASADLGLAQWLDLGRDRLPFADPLVMTEIEKNGLFADLANSFLVIATHRGDPAPEYNWDAAYYSINRRRRFQTETRLERAGPRHVVKKSRLIPAEAEDPNGAVVQNLQSRPFVRGEKLSLRMLRALRREDQPGEVEFTKLMVRWRDFLQMQANGTHGHQATLPAHAVDYTPFNLIVVGDDLQPIDEEWTVQDGPVTVGWVLFRGLYWLLVSTWASIRCRRIQPGAWGPFVEDVFVRLGYRLTSAEMTHFAERESAFQESVLESRSRQDMTQAILSNLGPMSRVGRLGRSATHHGMEMARRLRRSLRNRGW